MNEFIFYPPKMISELIQEFNNIYTHYYTAIGIIQRDYQTGVEDVIPELANNINKSKDRIMMLLDKNTDLAVFKNKNLEKYEIYLKEWLSFIDFD